MRRLVLALTVLAVFLTVSPPAGADIMTPEGVCQGSGHFAGADFTVRSKDHDPSDVIDIPEKDRVRWRGAVKGGQLKDKKDRRDIDGEVVVVLPAGQTIRIESWDKSTEKVANRGFRKYSFPFFFKGVKMKVEGHHDEAGKRVCSGSIYVKVKGSGLSNPLAWAAIAGLVISGGLLVFAGRPVGGKADPDYEDVNRA
jgi:hypothetical protein